MFWSDWNGHSPQRESALTKIMCPMAKETRRKHAEELQREAVRLVVEEGCNWRPRVRICDRTTFGGRRASICFRSPFGRAKIRSHAGPNGSLSGRATPLCEASHRRWKLPVAPPIVRGAVLPDPMAALPLVMDRRPPETGQLLRLRRRPYLRKLRYPDFRDSRIG